MKFLVAIVSFARKLAFASFLGRIRTRTFSKTALVLDCKEDFLIETSRKTVDMLKRNKFEVTYIETEGGHTWLNWQGYLVEFTPKLFGGSRTVEPQRRYQNALKTLRRKDVLKKQP